jgi:hypothetical protein
MEVELVRDGWGKLRAVDWYDFRAMGWMSSAIGTLLHLRSDFSDEPAIRAAVARFLAADRARDMHAEVLALAGLPTPLGNSVPMLNLRTQIALAAKEPDQARRAIALMADRNSQEPAVAQLLHGYYRDTDQYDSARPGRQPGYEGLAAGERGQRPSHAERPMGGYKVNFSSARYVAPCGPVRLSTSA